MCEQTVRSVPRRFSVAGALLLGAVVVSAALSACASTPASETTSTPSVSQTASPTLEPSGISPTAGPTASPAASSPITPAEGEVLVISAEVIDGALEVTAMVQGVSESDGQCSLELRDATEVSTVTGTAGNGVTYCGVMRVSLADVDQDDATFQVRYVSAVTRAESAVTPVQAAP